MTGVGQLGDPWQSDYWRKTFAEAEIPADSFMPLTVAPRNAIHACFNCCLPARLEALAAPALLHGFLVNPSLGIQLAMNVELSLSGQDSSTNSPSLDCKGEKGVSPGIVEYGVSLSDTVSIRRIDTIRHIVSVPFSFPFLSFSAPIHKCVRR